MKIVWFGLGFLVVAASAACSAPGENHFPAPLTVNVPTIEAGQRLPGEVVILIPDGERKREFTSVFLTATFHHTVGEALEAAAFQAYSQAFTRLRSVRRPEDLHPGELVLTPVVDSFTVHSRAITLLTSSHDARIGLRVTLSRDGGEIWHQVSTGEIAGAPSLKVVGDALGQAFQRNASEMMADVALGRQLAAAPPPSPPATTASTLQAVHAPRPASPVPATRPRLTAFPRGPERPDDIAVIIGNADYGRQGKDIPDVKPAYADAEGMRLYATQALGVRDGNVILLRDATGAQMQRVFGSRDDPRGQLHDWVKPGKSRVFVYYSGHGAPGREGGSPFLVPADADATRIELGGYPLRQLYDNLGTLQAVSVTVVLEACFSGLTPAGSILGPASPVFLEVKAPPVPASLTVITAGAANQMANWEQDGSHGLFTRYFLEGMSGKADFDKDGKVSLDELDRYLKDTLSYSARRNYGRDQEAQIVKGGAP